MSGTTLTIHTFSTSYGNSACTLSIMGARIKKGCAGPTTPDPSHICCKPRTSRHRTVRSLFAAILTIFPSLTKQLSHSDGKNTLLLEIEHVRRWTGAGGPSRGKSLEAHPDKLIY